MREGKESERVNSYGGSSRRVWCAVEFWGPVVWLRRSVVSARACGVRAVPPARPCSDCVGVFECVVGSRRGVQVCTLGVGLWT